MYMFAKDLQAYWNNPDNEYMRSHIRRAAGPACNEGLSSGPARAGTYGGTVQGTKDQITLKQAQAVLREVRKAVVTRDASIIRSRGLSKWLRPWLTVPHLANFHVPEGDFGVGIEIERGFISPGAASTIANKVRNWHYLALDWEGGTYPIEATFAPVLYSKFGSRSQAVRYSKILKENSRLLVNHEEGHSIGIHVNVSIGGVENFYNYAYRLHDLNRLLGRLSTEENRKYFGRARPYGWMYSQHKFIECKMFNSVADPEVLRKYVDVAVALVSLITDTSVDITPRRIRRVLETAYNKR